MSMGVYRGGFLEMKLTDVLRGGRQCDEEGVEIIMSRQACCMAADRIEELEKRIAFETERANTLLTKIADLFLRYSDYFSGCSKSDIEMQDEYAEKMDSILPKICEIIGHSEFVPDQCGKPEHDYCLRCGTRREDIGKCEE